MMPGVDLITERLNLMVTRAQRLGAECRRTTDPARVRAIRDELQVLLDSAHVIHEEILLAQIELAERERSRPWWRKLLGL